jgi:DNA-binding LacI/PurR family transcriptional regulator
MADVARLAGVNRVTASVALRGARAGTHVSEATRQRILDAARELGYTPNAIALALRRQRTDIIGYYVGYGYISPADPFNAAVIDGIQHGCAQHHQDLLIYGGFERRSTDEIYAALSSGKIDGLVLIPAPNQPAVEKLVNSHLPIVAIANSEPAVPSVVVDDVDGSRQIAAYLAQKGHQRVWYRADRGKLTSTVRRRDAFYEAAADYGMSVITTVTADWDGRLNDAERELLRQPLSVRPTVAVNWVDTYAYAMLDDCAKLGVRVPEDLAVVGFDGVPLRFPPARTLTTIRAPWKQVSETAVHLLMNLIAGQDVARETILPVALVVGDTA